LPENTVVYSLGKERGYSKIRQLFRLEKFLFQHLKEVDGVFIHMGPIYAIASFPFIKLFRKKMILWFTHGTVKWKLKLAEKMVDKILTASPESCRLKNRKKIEVVGHGIDTELFKPISEKKTSDGKFRILSVGRIAQIKDQETLVRATDILVNKEHIRDIEIKIIGSPLDEKGKEYFEKLRNLVAKKGLDNFVKFLPGIPHKKLPDVYRQNDLLINLCPTGGMDKVVLEAMASGILVLVCNQTFKRDLGNYSEELMFQNKNSYNLAQKINNLKDFNQREIGAYVRNRVSKQYNLDNLIQSIINFFK
jgi:glycosyltransferase involved in cell wall biosynthesis